MLDQRNVAGFGNVYVNDVPFITGVSPFQPVGSIDGLEALVGVGTALIRTNAERGPQNTTGRRLHTDARWVHGVGRRPCPICGDRLPTRANVTRRGVVRSPGARPASPRPTVPRSTCGGPVG